MGDEDSDFEYWISCYYRIFDTYENLSFQLILEKFKLFLQKPELQWTGDWKIPDIRPFFFHNETFKLVWVQPDLTSTSQHGVSVEITEISN